jgi:hypothetical protein
MFCKGLYALPQVDRLANHMANAQMRYYTKMIVINIFYDYIVLQ